MGGGGTECGRSERERDEGKVEEREEEKMEEGGRGGREREIEDHVERYPFPMHMN